MKYVASMNGAQGIGRIMSDINADAPVNKHTLLDCIEGNRTYKTRSGHTIEMDPKEIEYLSTICDQIDRMYLRLPNLRIDGHCRRRDMLEGGWTHRM